MRSGMEYAVSRDHDEAIGSNLPNPDGSKAASGRWRSAARSLSEQIVGERLAQHPSVKANGRART